MGRCKDKVEIVINLDNKNIEGYYYKGFYITINRSNFIEQKPV